MKVKFNGEIHEVNAYGAVELDGQGWTSFEDVEIVSELTEEELNNAAYDAWKESEHDTDFVTFSIAYEQGYKACLEHLNNGKVRKYEEL